MSEYYSITFRYMSRYNKFELIRELLTGDWTLEFNGMMKYLPKAPNDDTRDPYGEDFVCEPYDLAKYMNVAQTQYSSEENISFSAITQALQWPLLFFFDADGSINVSFTYLDVTFSEGYKLADLNLVLLNLFKFFHSNHCDILNYKVEWGD